MATQRISMTHNEPKRHHTVPSFYLESFLDPSLVSKGENKLWLYRVNANPVAIKVDKAAVEKYFYAYDDSGQRHFEVERKLARIEGIAAAHLRKLQEGAHELDPPGKSELATFLALQITRLPFFHKITDEIAGRVNVQVMKHLLRTPGALGKLLIEHENKTGESPSLSLQDLVEFAAAIGDGTVKKEQKSRGWTIKQMFVVAMELSPIIQRMNWQILERANSEWFVTSDTPVTLYDPLPPNPERTGFALSGKTHLVFPINRNRCLYADFQSRRWMRKVTPAEVRELNKRTISGAYRNVFSPYRSEKLMLVVNKLIGRHAAFVRANISTL